jgi:hypothetical protein
MTVKSSSSLPKSVFLDTNIYILGSLDLDSDESKILSLLVSDKNSDEQTRVTAAFSFQLSAVSNQQ